MKAQGKVKGILIEGNDGKEYLLGLGPTERIGPPTLSRRQATARSSRLRIVWKRPKWP